MPPPTPWLPGRRGATRWPPVLRGQLPDEAPCPDQSPITTHLLDAGGSDPAETRQLATTPPSGGRGQGDWVHAPRGSCVEIHDGHSTRPRGLERVSWCSTKLRRLCRNSAATRWMTGPARIHGGTSRAEPGTRGGTAQGRLYGEADRVKDGAQGRPAESGLHEDPRNHPPGGGPNQGHRADARSRRQPHVHL